MSGATSEREFLHSIPIAPFLSSLSTDLPTNVVGSPEALASLSDEVAALPNANVIALPSVEERVQHAAACHAEILNEIVPGGRTIILDPFAAHALLLSSEALGNVARKTREGLYLPLFTAAPPFRLFYSEGFSFEEPAFDDGAEHRWCWHTEPNPASVYLYAAEELRGRQVAFDIACATPGILVCRVGDQAQAFQVTEPGSSHRLTFDLHNQTRICQISIEFDGGSIMPDSNLDQRKALFYSFGGLTLSPVIGADFVKPVVHAPAGVELLNDRTVRRLLHTAGFFEVLGLATPWQPLLTCLHARSCFDYQSGFAFRDLYEEHQHLLTSGEKIAKQYAPPIMLYQARRLPSPGSEWVRSAERLKLISKPQQQEQILT